MGGVFIDAYNQSINTDIAGTITTRVDASNMTYVTEICNTNSINTREEQIRGGVLNTQTCPTISCSSWEHNCFLIEIYEPDDNIQRERNPPLRVFLP